ncbi:MAG: hypothetical protein ACYC1D_14735 [Acidimicrobiales bacterium]
MEIFYDRRAPEELMAPLERGGWAHSLVEYGRAGQYALDLQLRGYGDKGSHWATLYVGLTKVVDLHYMAKRAFHLDAHATYKQLKLGWDLSWEKNQPPERLAEQWPMVEAYLERVIPSVGPRFLKEGAVQSAISGFAAQDLVVIDREAAVTFKTQTQKNALYKELSAPLLAAVRQSNGAKWWEAKPTSLGGECDALAVTKDGVLLAIEVKPAKATAAISWAPLQVRHYANLFSKWASTAANASEVIQEMVDQRVRLGLISGHVRPTIGDTLTVRPVIAIAHGWSDVALGRLAEVQGRLVDAGLNDPALEVCSVNLAGRLDRLQI